MCRLTFIDSHYDLKTHMHKVVKRHRLIMADPGTCQHWAILTGTCKTKYPCVFALNTFIYWIHVVEYCLGNEYKWKIHQVACVIGYITCIEMFVYVYLYLIMDKRCIWLCFWILSLTDCIFVIIFDFVGVFD